MKIEKGTAKGKKYKAIFSHMKDGKMKTIKTSQFGALGYEDYTTHKDKKRREKYRSRHRGNLAKTDYMSPAHLSYYLLWGNSSSLRSNITSYKNRFKLK